MACTSYANDHALAPATVRTFQCGAHYVGVANALKAVVHAPGGHLDNDLLNGLVKVLGVDAVGGAKSLGQIELAGVGVHGNDAARLGLLGTLNDSQANTTQTKHRHRVTFLHLGGVLDRAQAGGYAAAQQADLLWVGIGVDLGQRDFGHHGVLRESGATHVVVNGLAVVAKAGGAIGHHAFALGGAHRGAQVGFSALAEQAFAAFGGVQRNDMVTGLDAGHAFTHLHHNTGAFVAQYNGEQAFGVFTAQGECIGVAHTGVGDFDQHLAFLRGGDVDFHNLQGFTSFKGNSGA